jgi:hypothetical protein
MIKLALSKVNYYEEKNIDKNMKNPWLSFKEFLLVNVY